MNTKKLNMYEINYVVKQGKSITVARTKLVSARNINEARNIATDGVSAWLAFYDDAKATVYPYATPKNDAWLNLGAHTVGQWLRFRLNGDGKKVDHALKALARSGDWEDLVGEASASLWEAYVALGDVPMHDLCLHAISALNSSRKSLARISDIEYDPSAKSHNSYKKTEPTQSNSLLAEILQNATESAGLTDKQRTVNDYANSGMAAKDVQEILGVKRPAYYQHLNAARYKIILASCYENNALAAYERSDIDAMDIATVLPELARKARMSDKDISMAMWYLLGDTENLPLAVTKD